MAENKGEEVEAGEQANGVGNNREKVSATTAALTSAGGQ